MADDADIRTLVEIGDMIAAVRLHRERHGGSLIDARAAVEAIRWAITQDRGRELGALEREVDELIRRGDRLGAIRRHREVTGSTLKEAADAIDARRGSTATVPDESAIQAAVEAGQKILAIKMYRERTGCGLAEAKEIIEARMQALLTPAARRPTFEPPDVNGLQPELDRLIAATEFIPAVRHYQACIGASVEDAIAAVDARRFTLMRAESAHKVTAKDDRMQPELDRLLRAGELIQAIKLVRLVTGRGLKDCKDVVDARRAELGV